MKKRVRLLWAWGLFTTGALIIFGTHIMMLFGGLPSNQVTAHAWINIIGGLLVTYAIYLKR